MCHNGRRGLRNDQNYLRSDATRAPHPGPQGDMLMGENAYFVPVGQRSFHADVTNSCVSCHMQATPPPDIISYNRSGTNHTFYASKDICSDCHAVMTAADVQGPIEEGPQPGQFLLTRNEPRRGSGRRRSGQDGGGGWRLRPRPGQPAVTDLGVKCPRLVLRLAA